VLKLRFQFRNQPWKDVLDWLARKADLSLVMDSPPPGIFNYRDDREYTPDEAIDLINRVLLTKGYALLRHERTLMLLKIQGGTPPTSGPTIPPAAPVEGKSPPATSEKPPVLDSEPRPILAEKEPPGQLCIYPLQNADPQTVLLVLQTLLAGEKSVRMTVEPKSHSLVVVASPQIHKSVAGAIKQLDVAPVQRETQLKVFTLVNAEPSSIAQVLAKLLPKEVRIAIDERTRTIIASGPPDALNVAQALLTRLDEAAKTDRPEPSASYEVRLVWLASGLTEDNKGEPPGDDLKDVVAELSRLGIKDPRQVGQMVVQNTSGGNFQIESSPVFEGQPAGFTASGALFQQLDRRLTMQIRISTKKMASPEGQNLNQLETQIVVPQKQYVVLATAPVGNITSAFVVQVTSRAKVGETK
jgi:hypothetical protein